MFHTLWIYHLVNTIFRKNGEQITGYSIFETNKIYQILIYIYIYIQNGIIRISFKTLLYYFILRLVAIVRAVLKYAGKIVIAFLISIHTKTLSVMKKNK